MASKVVSISGDIHLNLRNAKDYFWESSRFLKLFDTLADDGSDIVILSGDIFDKANVTLEEVGLFYEGLKKLSDKTVLVIDGNHEELSESLTTFDKLPHVGFTHVKMSSLNIAGVLFWLVGHPYIKSITNGTIWASDDKNKSILVSHYRSDIGFAKEEVDNQKVSEMFNDAILSDIHYRMTPADNIRYTSSPYGIHYSPEKHYGYCQVIINDGDYTIKDINLNLPSKSKISTTVNSLEDTLDSLDPENLYNLEISGDSTAELLKMIKANVNVRKFSFINTTSDSDVADIAEDLVVSVDNSLEDTILIALSDLELSSEELEKAKSILKEEL